MKIHVATLTNPGGRDINDDSVCTHKGKNCIHIFVGDGLGGYAGGRQASQAAGDVLMQICQQGQVITDAQFYKSAGLAEEAVRNLQYSTGGNMKTTMVFLSLEGGFARWMHVGDSRLYQFHKGKLLSQTTDHSVSQLAALMGDITVEQIRFHEDRNKVLRALGGENAKPELSEKTKLPTGQTAFLLCTDGFWEYVYESEMEDTLRKSDSPGEWLCSMEKILLSRVSENNDNYTAAAVFYRQSLGTLF